MKVLVERKKELFLFSNICFIVPCYIPKGSTNIPQQQDIMAPPKFGQGLLNSTESHVH